MLELSDVAVVAARVARDRWSDGAGHPWAEGLGDTNLGSLPLSARSRLYRLALRTAWIAFKQVTSGTA
jgi:hypothetical protein